MLSMAAEGMPSVSLASVIEDVLRKQSAISSDADLASRNSDEASQKRNAAARWLRRLAGVVLGKDLPAEPSDADFRIGLRSGIILCSVLNKVKPGAITKVVELSNDSVIVPDGDSVLANQYSENVRNFLEVVEELGIPTFEASDFEKGGNTSRIVECVLALKSYAEWKHGGGSGSWKYNANGKAPNVPRPAIIRMNSEPSIMKSISRSSSLGERSFEVLSSDIYPADPDVNDASNCHSVSGLVRSVLSGKRQDEVPTIFEAILNKIAEEFEHRLANNDSELLRTNSAYTSVSDLNQSPTPAEPSLEDLLPSVCDELIGVDDKNDAPPESYDETTEADDKVYAPSSSWYEMTAMDDKNEALPSPCDETTQANGTNRKSVTKEEDSNAYYKELMKSNIVKQQSLVKRQQKDVEELKSDIHFTKQSIQNLQMKYQQDMDKLGKHLHTLTHDASGYRKVLAENRKLYNIVQDLKGNIRVYCRVRPFMPGQTSSTNVIDRIDEGTITIQTPTKYYKEGRKSFTFNKVFGSTATQVEVFADTQPLVRSVLDGYNVCIFAYGQTGTGKTYTMSGPNNLTEETYGVNYRALNDLFFLSEERKKTFSYEISVQMMEIYNEQLRDLLVTDGSSNKKLDIRNSSSDGINVPDANRLPVSSTADVINLMELGQKNRAVSATAMNDRSSRSHSCVTVHVQGRDLTSGATLRGSMHLVDLAGSERVEKSEVTGDRLKEAVHINKSLSALGDVIAALAHKGAHIPYRNSKLTQLLQDSLGGQAKTLMFVHIAPDPEAVVETLSTLKFAERVSSVELGGAQVNKESGDIKELKEQIANLKTALAKKEEEPDRFSSSARSSSPESRRTKSTSPSPSPSQHQSKPSKDLSNGRQSTKEETSSSSSSIGSNGRRRSLDPEDLSVWPPLASQTEVPAKRDNVDRRRSLGALDEKSRNRLPAPYSDVLKRKIETALSDEINEFEAAASESSELDSLVSQNIKKGSNLPSLAGSKLRKPQPKPSKLPDSRSMIPTGPVRRQSMGSVPISSAAKNEKPSTLKRRTGVSK